MTEGSTGKEIGVTTVCFTPALVDYEAHHRRLWSIESVKVNNRKKEKSTDCKPWTISPKANFGVIGVLPWTVSHDWTGIDQMPP